MTSVCDLVAHDIHHQRCCSVSHVVQAAWYITRLLFKVTPEGVVLSFLFYHV